MRSTFALIGAAMLLAACGENKAAQQAEADAKAAANFTPPTVTSRLDYGGMSERRFNRMDHDGNDELSGEEIPADRADRIRALDRNGDGKVTKSEWSEGTLARFDAMDLNRDGSVTSDERERAEKGERPAAVAAAIEPGAGATPVPPAR